MKEFNENAIEDYYVDRILTSGLGFNNVRAVPYGSMLTDKEVADWTATTPFFFIAVGAETFREMTASARVYSLDPSIVVFIGDAYVTSDDAYRRLRDKARAIRHLISGNDWTTDGNIIHPVLQSQMLIQRDPEAGLMVYQQDYTIKTIYDTNQ